MYILTISIIIKSLNKLENEQIERHKNHNILSFIKESGKIKKY